MAFAVVSTDRKKKLFVTVPYCSKAVVTEIQRYLYTQGRVERLSRELKLYLKCI